MKWRVEVQVAVAATRSAPVRLSLQLQLSTSTESPPSGPVVDDESLHVGLNTLLHELHVQGVGLVGVRGRLIRKRHRDRDREAVINHAAGAGDRRATAKLEDSRDWTQELARTGEQTLAIFPVGLVGPENDNVGDHDPLVAGFPAAGNAGPGDVTPIGALHLCKACNLAMGAPSLPLS